MNTPASDRDSLSGKATVEPAEMSGLPLSQEKEKKNQSTRDPSLKSDSESKKSVKG